MTPDLRKRLILAFYIPGVLIAIAGALLTPVLPVYASTLTDAYFIIGIILAAMSLGRVVGSIPTSWLLRRLGIKYTMMLGLVVSLLPMLLLAFTRNLWLTIVLLFIVGLGLSVYSIARHAYVTVTIPVHVRGRSIGILGGSYRIGNFIGPLLGGWFGSIYGLQSAFLVYVVIALLSVLFVWIFMQHQAANEEATDVQAPSFGTMLKENRSIISSAGLGQIGAQITREGWRVLIPLYAANVLNLDVQTIGYVLGAGAAFDMLFFYMSGVIMDRFGRKWAIVPSFTMQGIGIGLILISPNALVLAIVAAFIGLANGLSSGTMMTLGSDLAPTAMRSEFLSLWQFIGSIGSVSGPVIVGSVAQLLVIQMSIVSIASVGLGTALLLGLRKPRQEIEDEVL